MPPIAEVSTSNMTSQDALCQNTLDMITSSSVKRDSAVPLNHVDGP